MNTKADQNSRKGTKDLHSNDNTKRVPGKLMESILSNMKTQIKKPHQAPNNGVPAKSKLEPEYLNNILMDINDVKQFESHQQQQQPHKLHALPKVSDRAAPSRKQPPTTTIDSDNITSNNTITNNNSNNNNNNKKTSPGFMHVATVNNIISKTEKRPKSGIKRRLNKLIEANKKRSSDDKERKSSGTVAHSSKQHAKALLKRDATHVLTKDEAAANNVQQISHPEPSIVNNTSASIAESNKREPKHKKTKKEPKKKELKENTSAVLENDKKMAAATTTTTPSPTTITTTAAIATPAATTTTTTAAATTTQPKVKSNRKYSSMTSCPPSILSKQNSVQSQQSKKIKLIVNQITSNLKQTGRFELNAGNIKRDIYIKGLSTCMTSQALDQINRILNPPRMAAYKMKVNATKLAKPHQPQIAAPITPPITPTAATLGGEESTRLPSSVQKDKLHLSKLSIANEINTFNKAAAAAAAAAQSPSAAAVGATQPPPQPTFEHVTDIRTKLLAHAQPKEKPHAPAAAAAPVAHVQPPIVEHIAPPVISNQEQELIKKINEKIDQIISSGLNSSETLDTCTSSVCISPPEESKIPQPPPPLPPPIAPVTKVAEPPRFMQAPIKSRTSSPTTPRTAPASVIAPHEPRTNDSPPQTSEPHIKNIINVVRNSEIVQEIKQNTITVLQNAIARQTPPEKSKTPDRKTAEEEEKSKRTPQDTTSKTVPSLKKFQIGNTDKMVYSFNAAKQHASLNNFRKPSRNSNNNSTSLTLPIGNRTTITTTHLSKNNINNSNNVATSTTNNGTNSSSTLNLMAALSSNKKFALLSPMEVVQDFINLVNHAKRNRKTFTICGNFYSLRRAFAERGWIEKMRLNIMEDRETWRKIEGLSNFELVDGMRNKEYGEKYRRVFLTKLLAGHQVDFYWDYLTNPFTVNNDKIKRTLINRFPYGATRAYTSKHGLTESLRDAHWYCIEGYANIFYPRTYNLSMIEEVTSFVEDFRITAVISLLQWIVANMATPQKILSAVGDVPTSVYNFATIQCHNYIKMKEHKDIDEVIPQAKDYEWEVFLEKYYKIVHNENCFKANERISAELMIEQSKYVLKKVKKYLPNLHLDGFKNMWLLKPNNGSRGCGIHVCRTLKYMMDTVNNRKDIKYVVQKYLERPLLIHKTKFDIRQWFLVTCMPNVKVWLYKECYLRFSSQMFDLNKLHESIHLTNNSIQCRYKNNNQRHTNLPEQNMWDSETFKKYLTEIGQPYAWRNNIYKGMKECLIALFMLCQSKMELRINSFELCGADFMLSEDYHPYLIEINSRPALYASTKITARMCPKVLEDVIKVTVDHARNPKASTGDFELIYTDSFNYSIPRNMNNLYIEGMSYFSKFIDQKPLTGFNTIVPMQQHTKEVKTDSIKKILNIEPDVVKIDVRNTLEKILAVVHNDSNSKIKEPTEERNKKFRNMLSEFVNIISNVNNVNEEF